MRFRSRLAVVEVAIAVLVLGFVGFLRLFPDKAACIASGRVVDATQRHCEMSAGDYVQLREHVILHSWEALAIAVIVGIVAFAVWRALRKRPQ
jgi:hypothetical protein